MSTASNDLLGNAYTVAEVSAKLKAIGKTYGVAPANVVINATAQIVAFPDRISLFADSFDAMFEQLEKYYSQRPNPAYAWNIICVSPEDFYHGS